LCRENDSGRLRIGDIGETGKRSIGGSFSLRISGGLWGNFDDKKRIEDIVSLLNRVLEDKSRMRWKSAGIWTGSEKKEGLSILRQPKSEFERMTRFVIINSAPSKVD
jgi:hypothetical protein